LFGVIVLPLIQPLGDTGELQPLLEVLNHAAGADGSSLGPRQKEALAEISCRFGL